MKENKSYKRIFQSPLSLNNFYFIHQMGYKTTKEESESIIQFKGPTQWVLYVFNERVYLREKAYWERERIKRKWKKRNTSNSLFLSTAICPNKCVRAQHTIIMWYFGVEILVAPLVKRAHWIRWHRDVGLKQCYDVNVVTLK